MKKVLGLAIVMVLGLALMASANGIILNMGFVPLTSGTQTNSQSLAMGLGYRVADWSFLIEKDNFSTFEGIWNCGFFWEKAGYKVGPVLQFLWVVGTLDDPETEKDETVWGGIVYKDLMFVVGLKQPFAEGGVLSSSMYAQLEFSTASTIGLEIGFELEFNMEDSLDAVFDDAW